MPTYQYQCADCGEPLEIHQSFTDDALTECPACGGTLRKVFNAVGVVFKGSGFYRNDSRPSDSSGTESSTSKSAESSTTKGTESSTTKGTESSTTKSTESSTTKGTKPSTTRSKEPSRSSASAKPPGDSAS